MSTWRQWEGKQQLVGMRGGREDKRHTKESQILI